MISHVDIYQPWHDRYLHRPRAERIAAGSIRLCVGLGSTPALGNTHSLRNYLNDLLQRITIAVVAYHDPIAFHTVAVDAGRLVIGRSPEQGVMLALMWHDVIHTLSYASAATVKVQGAELVLWLL